ncbi:MAG: cytochrome b N-terminal domain-containing protein [Gemmatimonadota bacterium]
MKPTRPDAGFWEERFGWDSIRNRLLTRPIPAEVGWLHTLGSVTLALILVLIATGVLLTLNYAPATEHAYHSVRYIERRVTLGGVVRGLHHWAASFLVVTLFLHLLHSFRHLAFRRPREFTWCTGVVLLVVVLAFAFTGYLLPWDEKAYWATVVGTNMTAQLPVVGTPLLHILRGGAEVGAATLSRFYGAHVALLPAALLTLIVLHLYLVVLHGISSRRERKSERPAANPDDAATGRSVPFWPEIMAMDAAAMMLTFALLLLVALRVGAPLEAPADPTNTGYVPRPEWYFLPLFQLLRFFPGSAESLVAVGLPALGVLILLALPWWSRPLLDRPWGRASLLGAGGLAVVGVLGLGLAGAEGGKPSLTKPPLAVARGRLLFDELGCPNCHSIRGLGGVVGPDLTIVGLRRPDSAWLATHLRDPRSIVPTSPMPALPLEGESMRDLVSFLLSLGNEIQHTPAAATLFAQRCLACHRLGGHGGTYGPNLDQVGKFRTVAYIHQYMEEPTSLNPDARMPPAVGLSHEQVEDVARYVVATALEGYERGRTER